MVNLNRKNFVLIGIKPFIIFNIAPHFFAIILMTNLRMYNKATQWKENITLDNDLGKSKKIS